MNRPKSSKVRWQKSKKLGMNVMIQTSIQTRIQTGCLVLRLFHRTSTEVRVASAQSCEATASPGGFAWLQVPVSDASISTFWMVFLATQRRTWNIRCFSHLTVFTWQANGLGLLGPICGISAAGLGRFWQMRLVPASSQANFDLQPKIAEIGHEVVR